MIFYFINSSCLVLSAIKPDYQAFIVSTPNFTPKSGKVGCFYIFLTLLAVQKENGFNISGIPRLPITPTPPSFLPSLLSTSILVQVYPGIYKARTKPTVRIS